MAAMFGHISLIKWLLYKNVSTNVLPHPFLIAMAQGHQEAAKILLKFGSNLPITYNLHEMRE